MGRKRNFIIDQSLEDLMSLRSKIQNYQSSQQLNCLILIKSAKYSTLNEIAEHVGVHYSSIQRWLKDYKENGIQSLLSPQTRNKPSKIITPEMHLAIEEKLKSKDNPFSGYVEVQEWLKKEFNVEVKYKWLWAYMRSKMKSRLKVPRKTNAKKASGSEESFFKTA